MSLKSFKTIDIKDYATSKFQDNVSVFNNQLVNNPLLSGQLRENVSLVSGAVNVLNHGLGRAIRGWYIVDKSAQADIWAAPTDQDYPNKTLKLSTSANVTVSIYFF